MITNTDTRTPDPSPSPGADVAAARRVEPLAVSVVEAARMLGIGRTLAYELVRTGALPTVQLGHRKVVPMCRLKALINGEPWGPPPAA